MRKIATILISVILALACSVNVFAASDSMSQKAREARAISYIEDKYPGAQVTIDDNGALQVYIPDQPDKNMMQAPNAIASTIYAPNGGTYKNFTPPIGSDPYGDFPYAMIYLPGDQTSAMQAVASNESIFTQIVAYAANHNTYDVCSWVFRTFGININPAGIVFLVAVNMYSLMSWVNTRSLTLAAASTGKVCITRTTTMGFPTNIYISWSGNYVTDAPYSDWGPTFYAGDCATGFII